MFKTATGAAVIVAVKLLGLVHPFKRGRSNEDVRPSFLQSDETDVLYQLAETWMFMRKIKLNQRRTAVVGYDRFVP